MIIGIDIDDTVSNSRKKFIELARKYNKEENIVFDIDTTQLDLTRAFGWNKKDQEQFKKRYLKDVFRFSKPKRNSVSTINLLKAMGHKIIFISSRKSDIKIKNIYSITFNWLKQYNFLFDKLVVCDADKLKHCKSNKIDVFIDDNFENCKKIQNAMKIAVFNFKTEYNKNCFDANVKKVDNWSIFYRILKNKEKKMKKELDFVDVEKREDFPPEPKGFRYIHFYGGTKNYRGYLAPAEISRTDFMEQYPQYVPIQNVPIYDHNGIIVRADPKFPCPGFYIFGLDKTYRAFDLLDDITFIRFSFILKKIKEGMRSRLNINYAHLLSNEKSDPFVNVHFWLVPINGTTSPDLLDFDVKAYLKSFEPKKEIDKIIKYNDILKDYIEEIKLTELDDQLVKKLSRND